MSATRPGAIFRQLHPADPDDGPLLARFAGRRDPAAFAALVRRHGPMVLAVCRRVTGNLPDAEDAFQAAFLVLARSAGSVRKPDRLGSWLYGVAVKVAGRARRTALRRARRETTVAAFPDVPAPESPPPLDVGPALHEELAALPAHHREPIVLCDLQGLSRADAAKALGVAEGTLSSRLANGRKRLAERLTRRGVVLSAAALPGVLADGRAAVPDELVSNTCGLAAAWAAGAPLPAAVVRLARGGFSMRGVLLGGVLTLTLAAGAALAAGFADPPAVADPPAAAPVAAAQPEPKAQPKKDDKEPQERPGAPRLRHWSDLNIRLPRNVFWTADGSLLAIQGQRPDGDAAGAMAKLVAGAGDFLVVAADVPNTVGDLYHLPARGSVVGFLPSDKYLLTVVRESGLISGASSFQVWKRSSVQRPGRPGVEEVYSGRENIPIPEDAYHFTPTPDGKTIRYLVPEAGTPVPQFSIGSGTLGAKEFTDGNRSGPVKGSFRALLFTPDAARVVTLTDAGAVEAYGLDGKRQWAAGPPDGVAKSPFGVEGGPTHHPTLAAARDGSRVLVVRGFVPPAVFDAATGKARPALEGGEPSERATRVQAAVSANGRLAALLYTPAVPRPNPFAGPLAGNPQPKGGPGGGRGFLGKGEAKLAVWDTETGRLVRSWRGDALALSFHPTQPRLAILEANSGQTRLGLWDFPWEIVGE
ncbi:MAG TPA: RNA polymerase sigma factor [Urbifossiella sp.]|nr:RNA polymerase sigma factor [Urbifossiella sp.]